MAGWQDFIDFKDDFLGGNVLTAATTPGVGPWKLTVTGAAPPTAAMATPSNGGALLFTLTAGDEVQNVCLDFNNILAFDIDQLLSAEFRVQCVASVTSAVSIGFGLQSARNNDLAATTAHAQFRIIGNNNVVVETDDDVLDNNLIATGKTLGAAYKRFYIDFSGGKKNVKFYIDGERVAASKTFDMSNYSASLQPFLQIQKTTGTQTGTATIDYVCVKARRY
jgi:hypothetical protein